MDSFLVLWILKYKYIYIQDIRNFNKLESKLIYEEKLCMPIVGLLGLFGGFINEYLRLKGDKYMPYTFEAVKDPFTEEI